MIGKEPVNILMVDDQPAKLLSYCTILEELGENLLTAGSGREALEQLLKRDIAVVLIDVIMPDLDGFELATMIRNHPRFERIAIIFVSAVALADIDLLRGYEHGGVDYVAVPIVPELLRAKVRVFAELYRKTRQLEHLNAELEQRVQARTAELAQANAELERRVDERTRERELALAQVHEMQKLESLGQLTGGVAHDFNNVLMAILANLDVIANRVTDMPVLKRLVDSAIRAAERGGALTRRMLAFAKRQELRPEAVDVAALVNGMTEMLRSSLDPRIEIVTEFASDLELVNIDPNQLELAVLNLALNARDAMPQGGRLMISARRETASAARAHSLGAGAYVCLSMTDTGVGMDDATLKRAPEPFFTTKGTGKGTGLGLSMVYGLATQSGGTARISSRPGEGTTVELWLPVADMIGSNQHGVTLTGQAESIPGRFILLVDDDGMVASATAQMVEQLGHRVLVAASGAAALEIVRGEPRLDLVITDHAMPGMTGLELAGRIRDARPDLPVVLATGYADLAGGENPGIPRLDKPYRIDKLAAMLATVVKTQPNDRFAVSPRANEACPKAAASFG
jgi:signal transduction histidine kinase